MTNIQSTMPIDQIYPRNVMPYMPHSVLHFSPRSENIIYLGAIMLHSYVSPVSSERPKRNGMERNTLLMETT